MGNLIVRNLHIDVAHEILQMIRSGALKKGQKINHEFLCKTLGVSRTPLREALRVLSAKGFIKLVTNRGSYVCDLTVDQIKELFDVMAVLEGYCARMAAKNMNEKNCKFLENLHMKLEEQFKNRNLNKYIKCNNEFHAFLQKITGNSTLNQIVNGLREKILLYRLETLYRPERFEESIREHRELLEAFRERNPQKAEELMKNHLMKASESLYQ